MSKRHKIWVNNKLFTVTNPSEQLLLVKLDYGINTIIIETPWARPGDNIFIRISSYDYECQNDRLDTLINGSLIDFENIKFLCYKTNILCNGEDFGFILFSNNTITFNNSQKIKMELFDSDTGKMYEQRYIEFGKRVVLKLCEITYKKVELLNHLRLKLTYYLSNGHEYTLRTPIFLYDITTAATYYANLTHNILNTQELTEYDRLCLQYKLNLITNINSNSKLADNIQSIKGNINAINSGIHMDSTIYSYGSKRVFFKSELDETIKAYHAYTPKNYDAHRKYPLLIYLSTPELTNYSQYLTNYFDEDVLSVDISQRGFTMGSYIGEAAIMEAFNDVINKFSIDDNRIYLLGHSNGAYGVWSIAQAYPHLFAGALIISGGVECAGICNMKNLKIINISSRTEKLYRTSYYKPSQYLKKCPKATKFLTANHCHNSMIYLINNKKILNELLKHCRNEYPLSIDYYTRLNRHTKAYWAELNSIEYGKIEAKLKVQIDLSSESIKVHTHNVSSFSLTLPPHLLKNKFKVFINSKYNSTTAEINGKCLFFSKNKSHFQAVASIPSSNNIYKGSGILDVYMGNVRIVYCINKLKKYADILAKPYSNGSNPFINVSYPTSNISNINYKWFKDNLIIIDNNSSKKVLKKFRNISPIKMDKLGFQYLDTRYNGQYCIIEIVQNPMCNNSSIIYINTNDIDLLNKNLFLRKIIIPSYSNGFHRYLNNVALIYDGKIYYKIFEYGEKPCNI